MTKQLGMEPLYQPGKDPRTHGPSAPPYPSLWGSFAFVELVSQAATVLAHLSATLGLHHAPTIMLTVQSCVVPTPR